jgi:hypothetical protein
MSHLNKLSFAVLLLFVMLMATNRVATAQTPPPPTVRIVLPERFRVLTDRVTILARRSP